MESRTIYVTPFTFNVDGYNVTVFEVLKFELVDGSKVYHVVVKLEGEGISSRVFGLDVRSFDDLVEKIRSEITKLKLLKYVLGEDKAREIVT